MKPIKLSVPFSSSIRLEESGCEEPVQPESVPSNDGTNASAFLAEIGTDGEVFADITDAAEETIWLLPEKINEYSDISKMYDPVEAYELLLAKKIMQSTYDFSEELPFSDGVE